jgi:murein peptide amidase A
LNQLPLHRCHDYAELIRQWRLVATEAGLKKHELCQLDGQRIVWFETAAAQTGTPPIYLSAGVHGDEPAATSGLLAWAQQNISRLRRDAFLLFPCLNPHGLLANTRVNQAGEDLNRRFHLDDDPVCGPWRQVIRAYTLPMGICLHEDYDAQGCYVYELSPHPQGWSRPLLQKASSARLPIDPRRKIDGHLSHAGVIQRQRAPRNLPGMPEAVVLYQMGCPISLTFETPSEFALTDRVNAHRRFLNAALSQPPASARNR